MSTRTFPAVERSLTVDVAPDWAFRFFTEKIGDWWPLEDYSIFAMNERGRPDEVVFEPGIGGRVYERLGDEEAVWGVVNVWDPPNRVAFTWKTNPDWEGDTQGRDHVPARGERDARSAPPHRLGAARRPGRSRACELRRRLGRGARALRGGRREVSRFVASRGPR
jgi:hypothetical protein